MYIQLRDTIVPASIIILKGTQQKNNDTGDNVLAIKYSI